MKTSSKFIVIAVLLVVVAGLGAGGWYLFRGNDPAKSAQALIQKGDLRGAQIELRNAVRQMPDSPDAHMRLGQLQMQLGDPVAGEKELKTARDLGADRWAILPQLAQAYIAQGRYKDVLTEVPPEGPKPEIAAKNLMLRAMAQVALNDIDSAKSTLAQAEKIAPGNVEVLLTASRLALALKDTTTAEQKVDQALAIDPGALEGLLMKGQILLAKGDKAGAMAIADKVVALSPNSASARLDRANQLIVGGNDAKAQEDVAAVLKESPRNAGATYLNAVLMVRAGRYPEAGLELQKLGPVMQRFPRALYFQALVSANLGQTEQAIDFANRYVARMPGDADGIRLLARTQLTAQRPEAAAAILSKAVGDGQNDSQTLDLLGRAQALMGQAPEAVKTLQRAASLAPDDATILTHLASSQMQQGDPVNAEASLQRSVDLAPGQQNAGEALVAAALSAGDPDKAEAALVRLRAQVGETEQVGILSGMIRLGRLDLDGGRAAFAETLKQFPNSVVAKLNLGKVLILQGRKPEGTALLKEILTKDPANIATLNTYIQLLATDSNYGGSIQAVEAARTAVPANKAFTAMLSDLIVRSGDPRRAVAMLQAMRDSEELPPVLLGALARAQASAGLNDEARRTFRDILVATPTDLDARRGQVDLLLKLKDTDAAKASLREGLASSPGNIGIMTSLVALETQQSGLEGAVKVADELRRNTANLPNSTVLKGDALMRAGKYPEAAQAFMEELKLAATAPLTLRLANAYASAGMNDDATRVLREWLKTYPEDADVAQMLGLMDIRQRRYADAEQSLGVVLSKRPSDTVAMNNLAWLYQRKGDPRARTLAQRAYLQAPTPETSDTLGWIMVGTGDVKSGLSLLQQSNRQRPDDPAIKYHLAVALKQSDKPDEAVPLLQSAVASATEFDDKPAARKLLEELTTKK